MLVIFEVSPRSWHMVTEVFFRHVLYIFEYDTSPLFWPFFLVFLLYPLCFDLLLICFILFSLFLPCFFLYFGSFHSFLICFTTFYFSFILLHSFTLLVLFISHHFFFIFVNFSVHKFRYFRKKDAVHYMVGFTILYVTFLLKQNYHLSKES